jgi:hypothetical protein
MIIKQYKYYEKLNIYICFVWDTQSSEFLIFTDIRYVFS